MENLLMVLIAVLIVLGIGCIVYAVNNNGDDRVDVGICGVVMLVVGVLMVLVYNSFYDDYAHEKKLKQPYTTEFDLNGETVEIVSLVEPKFKITYNGKCAWTTWGTKNLCFWIENAEGKKQLVRFDGGFQVRIQNEQPKTESAK